MLAENGKTIHTRFTDLWAKERKFQKTFWGDMKMTKSWQHIMVAFCCTKGQHQNIGIGITTGLRHQAEILRNHRNPQSWKSSTHLFTAGQIYGSQPVEHPNRWWSAAHSQLITASIQPCDASWDHTMWWISCGHPHKCDLNHGAIQNSLGMWLDTCRLVLIWKHKLDHVLGFWELCWQQLCRKTTFQTNCTQKNSWMHAHVLKLFDAKCKVGCTTMLFLMYGSTNDSCTMMSSRQELSVGQLIHAIRRCLQIA